MDGGTAPRRRLSLSVPATDTFSGSPPPRFSPLDRDRFFFFLLLPSLRCLVRCRSRLEDEEAGGGDADDLRRRLLRFSRERDRRPPLLLSELGDQEDRGRGERERDRRREDRELGLWSRDRCFLGSQAIVAGGLGGAGGAGVSLASRL